MSIRARAFLEETGRDTSDEAALDRVLGERLAAAHASAPGIAIDDAVFCAYLGARCPDGEPLESLGDLHVEDLYLACACTLGVPAAIARFDRDVLSRMAPTVNRVDSSQSFFDEVAQVLRHRLLVGDGTKPPRIASYLGHGPLDGWVRVATMRVALDLRRGTQHFDDTPLSGISSPHADPELELLRRRYGDDVQQALTLALAALTARDRNILRLYYVDDLGLDQIGPLYQVHGSTVSRWIARARRDMLEAVKSLLAGRLGLSGASVTSLVGLVGSQLDLSFHSLLSGTGR